MYLKEQNSLKQFEHLNTRTEQWVQIGLDMPQFFYTLYFFAPKNLNRLEIVNLANTIYNNLPSDMSWSKKYLQTLNGINNYLENNY